MNLASMLNGDPPLPLSRESSLAQADSSQPSPIHAERPKAELDTRPAANNVKSASPPSSKRKLDDMQERSNGIKQATRPAFEGSYTGETPASDIALKIKQFILYYLTEDPRTAGQNAIEIEAKLGQILDRDTGARVHESFPLLTSAVLHPAYPCRFQSDMSTAQHKAYNQALNEGVQSSNTDKSRIPMIYKHTYFTDSFYEGEKKKRVTTDDKTGEVIESIQKEKIDDLHIMCPQSSFDIRITINIEHTVDRPDGEAAFVRKKDRLSYSHQNYRIDLTQVKSTGQITHELEIELTRLEELRKQAIYSSQGLENNFNQLLEGYIGTIFTLDRL